MSRFVRRVTRVCSSAGDDSLKKQAQNPDVLITRASNPRRPFLQFGEQAFRETGRHGGRIVKVDGNVALTASVHGASRTRWDVRPFRYDGRLALPGLIRFEKRVGRYIQLKDVLEQMEVVLLIMFCALPARLFPQARCEPGVWTD